MKQDPYILEVLQENKKILLRNEEIIASNKHIKEGIQKLRKSLNTYKSRKINIPESQLYPHFTSVSQ